MSYYVKVSSITNFVYPNKPSNSNDFNDYLTLANISTKTIDNEHYVDC
jgi:hypothetical protein